MEQYQKRGYLLENFRLFHLKTVGEAQVEYHYHEFCKVLFFVDGSGSYVVDGQRYLLQPGDVVLVGSRQLHCPELSADVPYERIILYIDPDFLSRQSTEDCDLLECFAHTPVLRLKESRRQKLFSLIASLEKHLSGQEYGRSLVSRASLLRLLVEIGRDLQRSQPVVTQNSRVLAMMRYMDEHLEEDLTVEQLADTFYVSKYHMMRSFHDQTGMTVHTYLLRRRLLHARSLIEGGMRATEAGYRSGFRSYSTFTRAYGKHFGTTPTGRQDPTRQPEEDLQ